MTRVLGTICQDIQREADSLAAASYHGLCLHKLSFCLCDLERACFWLPKRSCLSYGGDVCVVEWVMGRFDRLCLSVDPFAVTDTRIESIH
jgi:hypothetical protein